MVCFVTHSIHSISCHPTLGSSCQVPLERQGCSQHRTLHRLSWGGAFQGKAGELGAPMLRASAPKQTDSFFHPLRCLCERCYSGIIMQQKAPTGHVHFSASTSRPQGFGCIYWALHLPCHHSATSWHPLVTASTRVVQLPHSSQGRIN